MTDLEFFFDPGCPWAWVTSRWVTEVCEIRKYEVSWKFISLSMINSDRGYGPNDDYHKTIHNFGLAALRVASAARAAEGNEGVRKFYSAFGNSFHNQKKREGFDNNKHKLLTEILQSGSLPTVWADSFEDETHTPVIRYETDLALSRTGKDVGTPILTFKPGAPNEGSFFGPVISKIPRGQEAVKLWDAIEVIATTSGMAELKRSLRSPLDLT
ncbi:unannotated protein [freshwater metagenome]|jgi:hypothetical protein|uniref:Unannotated protein n=1 Tax=freshwater metagenome TaxID=449393 RepID=A0A6J7P7N6_9ZZZZ|nr:hypothetical protein [Actinomycetota bacterium]MSX99687.1 hypothetical protein [Actinomycetota bacterium]MSZ67784.1 hypothetical protein [Actinomycetota bacterium]MTA65959.1 hypothetical protein [Actinomycetota bacterium]MTH90730.1 hypothetical protein [Actinomycetota bacterium]